MLEILKEQPDVRVPNTQEKRGVSRAEQVRMGRHLSFLGMVLSADGYTTIGSGACSIRAVREIKSLK